MIERPWRTTFAPIFTSLSRGDPETQTLEDAACLVFLETELAEFSARHDEAKIVDILRKTWRKMSANAREAALGLDLPAPLKALVAKAVA